MKRIILAALVGVFLFAPVVSVSPFGALAGSSGKFNIVCTPAIPTSQSISDTADAYLSRTFVISGEDQSSVEIFTNNLVGKVEYRKWDITDFQDEFFVMTHTKDKPTHRIIVNRLSGVAKSLMVPEKTEESEKISTPIPEGFTEEVIFKLIEILRCRKAEPKF